MLDRVSLGVERGEMIALLGSSGCGKTTLLRAIAGFVTPDEGTIRVGGVDITRLPPEKRETAMMFQSYALWPHMNVAGNIGYGLKMRGWKKDAIARRVDEMLTLLQLDGYRAASGDAAVRRPAAARRAGPRARGRSAPAAARRADVQPRLQGAARTPPRTARAAAAHRHHGRLCHARPRGGADAGRPHRRDRCRPHRADRRAGGDLPRARVRVRRRFHGRGQRARLRCARATVRWRPPWPARPRTRAIARAFPQRRGAPGRCSRAATRPMRWCSTASLRSPCTSGKVIAIACAPTAPTSGSTRRSAIAEGQRRRVVVPRAALLLFPAVQRQFTS